MPTGPAPLDAPGWYRGARGGAPRRARQHPQGPPGPEDRERHGPRGRWGSCLLYTSDAADDTPCVDL
eukprot:5230588-Pyramimonas_sp.AAC.1